MTPYPARVVAVLFAAAELTAVVSWATGAPHASPALVVAESCVIALGIVEVAAVLRRWRVHRRRALDRGAALTRAVHDVLPATAARLLVGEARLFAAIGRWTTGRPALDRGALAIANGRGERPVLLALVPLTLLETCAIALLLHEYAVHWVLVGLSVYGTLWLLGVAAASRVRPHVLTGDRLTLRNTVFDELTVDLTGLVGAEMVKVRGQRWSVTVEDSTLTVAFAGSANVQLTFGAPIAITGDRDLTTTRIRFAADAPGEAVRLLNAACARRSVGARTNPEPETAARHR